MNRLDQHVDFTGKPIAEESYNEINKMLYRIKDFESVYNISENKFRQKEEDFLIKRSIDDVIEIAKNDIKKKNIELTVNHSGDLPNLAKGDSTKFKQILLNIILQSLAGMYKGAMKLRTEKVLHN